MEEHGIEIAEQVSASRKLGAEKARELVLAADTISVAKGRKLDTFEGGKVDEAVIAAMLGSTGNLRAPTIKVGDIVLVGFNEEVYGKVFG